MISIAHIAARISNSDAIATIALIAQQPLG
jgi:hypothetical protein